MKKLLFIILLFCGGQLYSQDLIILKSGAEIEAKVLEINSKNIDYKKFSNINGPTYHLDKSEIFMIKYQSGDKDIFSNIVSVDKPATNTISETNNPSEFVYNPAIGNSNCQVQKSRGAKIYGNKSGDVFYRQDLVFYGYDMTYTKLTNPDKMGQSMKLVQEYFIDWNNEFNKEIGFNNLKRWMDKPHMLMGTPVFKIIINVTLTILLIMEIIVFHLMIFRK